MSNLTLNHFFYKTFSFWFGLVLAISNSYDLVQRGHLNFDASLDLIGLLISLALMLSAVIKRQSHAGNKTNGTTWGEQK
ncbi:hypothetical protein [Lentilactobacillus parafarraginis]|nr:hypothetical protein [Lentilactobacillus parafarraginis]